jgi:GNAT superfamily N-acetyltransferase
MIRRATTRDVSQIASLYHSVWHETIVALMPAPEAARRTLVFFIDRMAALQPTTFVAEKGRTIAGFASWSGAMLGQLYVAAPYRGTGVAQALLQAVEQTMAAEGVPEAELYCISGNDRACRFYERHGWRHSGSIVEKVAGFASDADLPCLRFTKALR